MLCCFGGRREKWYSFFGDLPSLRQYLNRDCPGHDDLEGYAVTQGQDGRLHYPTAEEAEYPWGLCRAYARALRQQLDADGLFEKMVIEERERHFAAELTRSTTRLSQELVTGAIASVLARREQSMMPGEEKSHLRSLLRSASYRGTDMSGSQWSSTTPCMKFHTWRCGGNGKRCLPSMESGRAYQRA